MQNIEVINKSKIVINILCSYLGKDFKEINDVVQIKENKYLLLLLLKNYRCLNRVQIKNMINIGSEKSISYSIKKAEEKLLINRDFRENYFRIEKYLEDII